MEEYEGTFIIIFFVLAVVFIEKENIKKFIKNQKSEVLSKEVYVVRKRFEIDLVGEDYDKVYYVDFIMEGNKVTYKINKGLYDNLEEETYGILTYKGSRFISFENEERIIEKL